MRYELAQPDKYFVFEFSNDRKIFVSVHGLPIVFKGYESFDFFLYKSAKGWRVIEAVTGMEVNQMWLPTYLSKKEAISGARAVLKERDASRIMSAQRFNTEKYGLSPRYKEVAPK